MRFFLPVILLALGTAACRSDSTYGRSEARLSVDDKALVNVPVAQRDAITKARAESEEMRDHVAAAKRDIESAEDRVAVAKKEVDVADEEVEAADKRLEVARKSNEESRASAVKDAEENRNAVRAHRRWADAQVVYLQHRVDEMKARLALEKLRVELADAKVELAKAKAVNAADHPARDEYDVAAFDARVTDLKTRVAMAEVDTEAWEKKIKLYREALDAQAKAVPSSYRDSWRKVDDVNPK